MRVFIVGVNQGLGLALSRLMAEQGHTVYAGYRNKMSAGVIAAAEQFGGYEPVEIDVTDEGMAAAAAQHIAERGKLDAVAVVAGILPDSDRQLLIIDASIGDLRAALEVNAIGSAIMIKHFNHLVADGGIFAIISSEAASMANIGTNYPLYSISKAAQNKLAGILAKTVNNYSVYAIHPGRMNTVMGRAHAQIEPEESAEGICKILTCEKKIPPENGWFIDYHGEAMVL